jgi:hypothetical protein
VVSDDDAKQQRENEGNVGSARVRTSKSSIQSHRRTDHLTAYLLLLLPPLSRIVSSFEFLHHRLRRAPSQQQQERLHTAVA